MTVLSINVNKIALLRNSRGRDYPNVVAFAKQMIALGVRGITVHPRPDERHITRADVYDLSHLLQDYKDVEFNIEGYPSEDLLDLVGEVKPAQCTLVPDKPGQLTSDHGWDVAANKALLLSVTARLKHQGIRSALFLDADVAQVEAVAALGADRIELYTEAYASRYASPQQQDCFDTYVAAAKRAHELGVGLNAGHDLDLDNLAHFLTIPNILEVSIGHALVVESIQSGVKQVVERYLAICNGV